MDTGNSTVDTFINNYRQSLADQYQAAQDTLNQQRDTDYATIMSNANTTGTLYSNFPERSKVQYEAETYMPNLSSAYSTYQTGLDTLRSNTAELKNNIATLQEKIAKLNAS